MENNNKLKQKALIFIIFIGLSSLFCDMTHAGAKGIYGAYLSYIGASAAAIGFISGLAQFTAHAFSLLTGYIADKRHNYWTMTFVGYLFCAITIPALALTSQHGWIIACFLIVIERIGKAFWQPSRNTLISFASSQVGQGKAFSIQGFFNKLGACLGPLMLFVILLLKSDTPLLHRYQLCFVFLGIPAIIGLLFIIFAKRKFSHPETFESINPANQPVLHSNKIYILFAVGIFFFGLGMLDFPLITMHLSQISSIKTQYLPLFFLGAMLVSSFASLYFGHLFDKVKLLSLALSTFISCSYAFFVFGEDKVALLVIGILIWGIGVGAMETILKSTITLLVVKENRSKGFGVINVFWGISLFAGSWICGILYDVSTQWLMIFSFTMQFVSAIFFVVCHRQMMIKIRNTQLSN